MNVSAEWLVDWLRPVRFPGKGRLLNRLVRPEGKRWASVFGYRMHLDLTNLIDRMVYLGTFERQETSLALRWLKPGMTFLDVGANIGYFTLLAARRVGPTGQVIAVEPSPSMFERLSETIATNKIAARLEPIGFSDVPGECTLYIAPDSRGNHSPTMTGAPRAVQSVQVPVKRLDDCLDEWGVETVDLMKLDVEGHEPKVLAGASRMLESGRIRAILCEFNDYWLRQAGSSPQALHETLTALGFEDQAGEPKFRAGGLTNRFLVRT